MRYSIVAVKHYLRAELLDRETVEETREFLSALAQAARKHNSSRVLICVHSSRPIFRIEQYQASAYLKELAARPHFRVALVAHRADVRAAHQYVELVARQQSANLRSFEDEDAAIEWLRAEAPIERARQ
ncbi:MAG: STAS/SEC14 domain-containing protein [Betaproteobacteria bacterium]